MTRKIHYFCMAARILVACFIGHAQGAESHVKRSWDKAQIYLPKSLGKPRWIY